MKIMVFDVGGTEIKYSVMDEQMHRTDSGAVPTPQNTQADSEPKAPTYKYYTSIRVSSGDTLWDIAKEYRTEEYSDISSYIAEVREINHLSSNQITDGMYLCIPYYSEEYKS